MEKQELPAAGDETVATECTYGGCRTNDGGHDAPPCFDCSICLEPAGEPVVTLCGHLYCRPCVRQWLRSGWPGAQICPVCNAAVSEDRLVPLYGHDVDRRRNDGDGDGELRFDVRYSMDCIQNQHGQHYGAGAMDHRGWVLHSNAGRVIGSAAVAVLPWAFPGGRLPLPPRLVIASNDGRRQRRVENSLHQIWLFLAVSALLCFLLF